MLQIHTESEAYMYLSGHAYEFSQYVDHVHVEITYVIVPWLMISSRRPSLKGYAIQVAAVLKRNFAMG